MAEPVGDLYFCPRGGEVESASNGGFDVCCDAIEYHIPVAQIVPNGCRYCGIEMYKHCWRWIPDESWHRYESPTNEQRLERMRLRREHVQT